LRLCHAAGPLIAIGVGVALAPETTAARVADEPGVVVRTLRRPPVRELRLLRARRVRATPGERDLEAGFRSVAQR
jgi:hypothetical protein